MNNYIKAEFIKDKRSANATLMKLVPVIVVVFNLFMVSLMGVAPTGKSYVMATTFNWYPILILPVILSLLVVNSCSKETPSHLVSQKSLGLSGRKTLFAKNVVVLVELLVMLIISSVLADGLGIFIFKETIHIKTLIMATITLFIGSLPVVGMSFLLFYVFHKKVVVILINFLLVFPSALIAVQSKWVFFPWAYSLRMLAPIIGVHPNGTFLTEENPLMTTHATYLGILLSLMVYLLVLITLNILIRRKNHG